MRVVVAMDSFKGTFSSKEVGEFVKRGIKVVYPDAIVEVFLVADGGEGTLDAIIFQTHGQYINVKVNAPLGNQINAKYGIVDSNIAIIEMAEASGLGLVPEDKRNPLITSSFGTGQLIKDALDYGCKKIIIGIGGSATNDGGIGLLKALGIRFLDKNGFDIGDGGGALELLTKIDATMLDKRLADTEVLVACDVSNPLCGEQGASSVYGPQKGATPEMISKLDENLHHFSSLVTQTFSIDNANIHGSGAAGGVGYALITFCNASLQRGIDIVIETVKIEEAIKNADIVITGEGRIDAQSLYGKTPIGLAKIAKKHGKPIFVIAGSIGDNSHLLYDYFDSVLSSVVSPATLEDIIDNSQQLIEDTAERLFRIIRAI